MVMSPISLVSIIIPKRLGPSLMSALTLYAFIHCSDVTTEQFDALHRWCVCVCVCNWS